MKHAPKSMNHIPDQHEIAKLCQENEISYLGLFGSFARNESTKESDIDILADFTKIKSLFELARIQSRLESLFDKKVDLVQRKQLKSQLKPYILKDLKTLYGQG